MQSQTEKQNVNQRLRALRYQPQLDELFVRVKTLGTLLSYDLPVLNFSKTGFLLVWQLPYPMPFRYNTLVEGMFAKVEDTENHFSFIGRVVRQFKLDGERVELGINIVQMEEIHRGSWEKLHQELVGKGAQALPQFEHA